MSFGYELTPKEQARQEILVEKLTADARAEGLTVDAADLLTLPSVRLCIVSPEAGLPTNYMDEVRSLVPDQVRRNEVARQLQNAESALHADISKLNIYQKAALGHQLEAARKATEAARPKSVMTADEEVQKLLALRQISNPAQRLAIAREWGLA